MGGGGSSAAPQFNAGQTAQQQSQANVQTGVANSILNNTNQTTPFGNLTYNQTGTTNVGGNDVPSYSATQTLSGPQQTILDKTQDLSIRGLNAASPLLDRVAGTLSTPLSFAGAPGVSQNSLFGRLPNQTQQIANGLGNIDLSYKGPSDPTQLRNSAYDAIMSRTGQELGRSRAAEQVQLANQGIAPGSEAWNRATQHQDQALVDASNQATLQAGGLAAQDAGIAGTLAGARSQLAGTQGQLAGQQGNLFGTAANIAGADFSQQQALRNQYINEYTAQRNSPLTDYQSLFGLSGGVSQPNFVSTPQGSIPQTDVTTPAIQAYQAQQNAYNTQNANNQSTQGGLFGLAGTALGAGLRFGLPLLAGSDSRMKENIRHIGHTHDGQRLYFFTYKSDPATPHIGLMAQEVEKVRPDAVIEVGGMKYVDYAKALEYV